MKVEVKGFDHSGFKLAVDGIDHETLKQMDDADSLDSFSSCEEIIMPLEIED